MKLRICKLMMVGLFFYMPFQSMGWGLLGHRIVGQIADNHLNAKAKIAIKSILGNESVAMSANWSDFIKSDTNFKYLDPWHYVNFDSGIDYTTMQGFLKEDTAVDAYSKLTFLTKQLKNKKLDKAIQLF